MIYENYYKPEVMRKFDKLKYKIDNEERKFGIMQISSKNIITDEESIELAIKKLEKIYLKITKDKKRYNNRIKDILENYYSDSGIVDEIINVYEEIKLFDDK